MTLQYAPRYDLDGFELGELGIAPLVFVLVGAAAAGASAAGISAWLNMTGWSAGQYNDWMRTMNATIAEWDTLGWKYGCWKDAATRKSWLNFWQRFSTHFKAHGIIHSGVVTDTEELPARDIMKQLIEWGAVLNQCGAPVAVKTYEAEQVAAAKAQADNPPTDWGSLAKWVSIGIVGLVGLNFITGLRGVFDKKA